MGIKTLVDMPSFHSHPENCNENMNQTQVKTCEKKLKTAELKINKILGKIESYKLKSSYVSKLDVSEKWKSLPFFSFPWNMKMKVSCVVAVLSVLMAGGWSIYTEWPSTKSCHLHLPSSTTTLFRPPEDCSMCSSVGSVVRLANTSATEFEQYAYSATPVIVTDATQTWKAFEEFSFKFFANFYRHGKMGSQINDCFFFAYKSGLHSLQEVFTMDEARANLSGEPWYIGWSTCYDEETRKLREYYNRPYFLPSNAESDMVDWVFMGGPGQGAHMHVDSVKHMSWQAQIRGRKQWQLAPPPECFYRCRWLTFTVAPGEILVVDTNRWYHKTNVLPGDISITIGAEYD